MNDSHLRELLAQDTLEIAERMTGEDWHESEQTLYLGFGLQLLKSRALEQALSETDDTLFCNDVDRYLRIVREEGFEIVGTWPFEGLSYDDEAPYAERLYALFHPDGLLLTFDTHMSKNVNAARLYCNWESVDGSSPARFSGERDCHEDRTIHVGFWDAREALRHLLRTHRASGRFLNPWPLQSIFMQLNHYADYPRGVSGRTDYEHARAVSAERLSQLPAHVRICIGLEKSA